jgi:ABC-2 type transport system permease protein
MWSSFYSVFRKEFLHIIRDVATLRLTLMLPVLQLLLFGFIDQTVHDVPTVVVDQDRSVDSRLLMDQLQASKTFKIRSLTSSPREAREQIRAGRARVGIVIPPKFRNRLIRQEAAQVLVLIDGSDSAISAQALASVNGLVAKENLARLEQTPGPQGLAAQPIILFNPEGRTANYLIPGLVAVLLQFVGVLLAANAVVRERDKGTLEQLLVTPIHPLGLVLGKLGPYLLVGLVEMTLVLVVMSFGFRVPIRGSVLFLYGMAVIYLFALLAAGLLISTRAQTQIEAQQLAQTFLLPALFLSGYIFPFEGLPIVLKGLGLIFPVTHMIAIMRGVVLRDANALDLWPNVLALMVMSVVLVFAASRSLRKVAR